MDDARGDEDRQPPGHLTQSHAPPPDHGGEDLAGELEADEEGGGDVEPPQQTRHQPQGGEILTWPLISVILLSGHFYLADQSIAETEDRGEEEESDERTAPACLVDDHRHQPARDLLRPGKCRLTSGLGFPLYLYLPPPEHREDVRW